MSWLDLLFPKRCVGCGRVSGYVCAVCVNSFRLQDKQVCPMCNKPSIYGLTHARCKSNLAMNGLIAVFVYKSLVCKVIAKVKYQGVFDWIDDLVELVISMADMTPLNTKKWIVTPIPLHKNRLKNRGFNQSALLATRLANYFDWEYQDLLVRTRFTKSQMQLHKKDRLENVKGAFEINSQNQIVNKLHIHNVLLIDDVWTTGATMRECAKVLKKNGVHEVWGLVVAA